MYLINSGSDGCESTLEKEVKTTASKNRILYGLLIFIIPGKFILTVIKLNCLKNSDFSGSIFGSMHLCLQYPPVYA